jgi:hypothetical protein
MPQGRSGRKRKGSAIGEGVHGAYPPRKVPRGSAWDGQRGFGAFPRYRLTEPGLHRITDPVGDAVPPCPHHHRRPTQCVSLLRSPGITAPTRALTPIRLTGWIAW